MSLKALQERRPKQLEDVKEIVRPKPRPNTFAAPKIQNSAIPTLPTSNVEDSLVSQLRRELQLAEKTVTHTIEKNARVEKELNVERKMVQDLTVKLHGSDEQIRVAQATQPTEQATNSCEKVLQEQLDDLKRENSNLKSTTQRLYDQLQIEKTENAGRLPYMASAAGKGDRDDDEDVHSLSSSATSHSPQPRIPTPFGTSRGVSSPKPAATFKMPTSFEYFSKMDSASTENRGSDVDVGHLESSLFKNEDKKRKRTLQEEIDEELPELHLDEFEAPIAPRKKKRTLATTFSNEFHFNAICGYDRENIQYMPSGDVKKFASLQERINKTKDIWEHHKGKDWLFDFMKTDSKFVVPTCVTMKLAGKRTKWRSCCVGQYACMDCVKNGRPCFTWVKKDKDGANKIPQWSTWEFRLLPLHEEDRTRKIAKGRTEVRYWLDDETEFQDKDVLKRDEGDDDYVD